MCPLELLWHGKQQKASDPIVNKMLLKGPGTVVEKLVGNIFISDVELMESFDIDFIWPHLLLRSLWHLPHQFPPVQSTSMTEHQSRIHPVTFSTRELAPYWVWH